MTQIQYSSASLCVARALCLSSRRLSADCAPDSYVIGIWGFKMSLLFAYLRFIPMPRYRAVIIGVMVFITIGHFSSVIGFYIMCTPVRPPFVGGRLGGRLGLTWPQFEENWGPGGAEGSCASRTGFYLTFSALTVVWDVLVCVPLWRRPCHHTWLTRAASFVLPIPVLAKTNMKIQRKAALICLFLLGIFVTVVQVVRIHAISQLTSYVDAWLPILWSIVEGYVGILVASVPTLAPLVRCMAERTRSGTASNRSGTGRSKVPYELHNLQGTKLSNGVRTHVEEESDDSPTAGAGLGSRTRTAGFADSTEHIL